MFEISGVHYITQDSVKDYSHARLAEEACKGGADWIQLRMKNASDLEVVKVGSEVLKVCKAYGSRLIINDHPILAQEIGAAGVHLGKNDLDPLEARKLLGPDFIIGGTANTIDDIKLLSTKGVNYIGLGPYRFTITKKNISPVLGIEGYRVIMAKCRALKISIPVIAIGGIISSDIMPLLETGIHGIAISGVVSSAPDKAKSMKNFINAFKTSKVIVKGVRIC